MLQIIRYCNLYLRIRSGCRCYSQYAFTHKRDCCSRQCHTRRHCIIHQCRCRYIRQQRLYYSRCGTDKSRFKQNSIIRRRTGRRKLQLYLYRHQPDQRHDTRCNGHRNNRYHSDRFHYHLPPFRMFRIRSGYYMQHRLSCTGCDIFHGNRSTGAVVRSGQ